jgi:hypothetical protein
MQACEPLPRSLAANKPVASPRTALSLMTFVHAEANTLVHWWLVQRRTP